jgi:hypothetical protein
MVSKKLLVILAVLAVIFAAILGILLMFNFIELPRPVATLVVDSGTVQVKHGDGSWTDAASGMELNTKDSVKTLENSGASIIFFDSNIMRLDQNTEVSISSIVSQKSISFDQASGNTWSKISKASGIREYEVSTPTTVATVRGTGFAVKMADGKTDVLVGHGTVNVSSFVEEEKIIEGKKIKEKKILKSVAVEANHSTTVLKDRLDVVEVKRIEVPDAWIDDNRVKDEKFVEEKAKELIIKHKALLDIAKSRYGVTDEQIKFYSEGFVRGDFTIKDAVDQGIISEADLALIPPELKRADY